MKDFEMSSTNIRVKLADFGFSKTLEPDELTSTRCGSPVYMAPEIIMNKMYSHNSDVWSLGCIFYQMIFGLVPFYVTTKEELPIKLVDGSFTVPMISDFSLQGALFLIQCLTDNPKDRMSVKDIVKHPYLQQVGLEEIQGEKVCEFQNATELAKFGKNPEGWISRNKNKDVYYQLNSKTPEQNGETLTMAAHQKINEELV